MGLDMYLHAHKYTSEYSEKNLNERLIDVVKEVEPEFPVCDNLKSVIIDIEVGYWRKANHIHKWFVNNVQDGKDDCGEYYVSEENLKKLLELCKKVLETKDTSLLSTQSGFFFGSTEYDDYYYKDIENTINIIENCLKLKNWGFKYQSSW